MEVERDLVLPTVVGSRVLVSHKVSLLDQDLVRTARARSRFLSSQEGSWVDLDLFDHAEVGS